MFNVYKSINRLKRGNLFAHMCRRSLYRYVYALTYYRPIIFPRLRTRIGNNMRSQLKATLRVRDYFCGDVIIGAKPYLMGEWP